MMDVSDGLAADLPRLARASGVRLVVETTKLPASYAFRRMCSKLEVPFEKVILSGGEDYELVMTLPGPAPSPDEVSWTCIGEVAAGRGVVLRDEKGRSRPLAVRGFDHFKRR